MSQHPPWWQRGGRVVQPTARHHKPGKKKRHSCGICGGWCTNYGKQCGRFCNAEIKWRKTKSAEFVAHNDVLKIILLVLKKAYEDYQCTWKNSDSKKQNKQREYEYFNEHTEKVTMTRRYELYTLFCWRRKASKFDVNKLYIGVMEALQAMTWGPFGPLISMSGEYSWRP